MRASKLLAIIATSVTLLFLAPTLSYAQSLDEANLKNIQVDELSDEQIQKLWERAQSRGLTMSELEKMAIARGVKPSQIMKLRQRIREVRNGDMEGSRNQDSGRSRQQADDSGKGGLFSSLQNDSLAVDSLRRDSTMSLRDSLRARIFGASLFSQQTRTFEPSLNIPTPANYQLGPGDVIIIDIWGAAENTYNLDISPEGSVRISGIGPVYLNGLTIEEARTKLTEKLSQIYSGLKPENPSNKNIYAQISLGSVRSIKVSMIGEVVTPGTYTLPSLATVFNALYAAGGPTVDGSFRNIEIIRENKIHATLDVYDFLTSSDQSDNIRLRDQDIIKIPPYLNRVELIGEIKREGLFEMIDGEPFSNLLTYAGGFTDKAYTKRIHVDRKTDTELKVVDLEKERFEEFTLLNGDRIEVKEILNRYQNRLQIRGAVYRPGSYELRDSTTLYSLIRRAEGVTGDAFLNRALIYRTQPDLTVKAIPFNISKLMQFPDKYDIELVKDDLIQISSIFDLREELFITIVGSVNSPGQFPYIDSMTLEDLIFQADGFKDEATPLQIEVARRITGTGKERAYNPDIAKIIRLEVDPNLTFSKELAKFTIEPFDKIFVRKSPAYQVQQDVTIEGEVLYPGTYTLDTENMRISDLLERAGGITPAAFISGATMFRSENNIGQIGIELDKIVENPESKFDLILEKNDRLVIPKELQIVDVSGEVLFPVGIRYEKGRSLKDYITAAGGFSEQAAGKKTFVVYANGDVDRVKKFLFFKFYPKLEPGAKIIVPTKEQKPQMSPQERIAIISAVISTLSIVATTLNQLR